MISLPVARVAIFVGSFLVAWLWVSWRVIVWVTVDFFGGVYLRCVSGTWIVMCGV